MSERNRNLWKVTEELYGQIKQRGQRGGLTQAELGALFGVSRDTAKRVMRAGSFAEYQQRVRAIAKKAAHEKPPEEEQMSIDMTRERIKAVCREVLYEVLQEAMFGLKAE